MLDYVKRHHVGVIALFVALGGTSYAATRIPRNSVGSEQIRPGAVTAAKIHDGAVTAAKLSPELKALLQGRTPQPAAKATWRDPAIATAIRAAGQTIVSQKIVTVEVTAPWVGAGLSIGRAQHLWIDTRSDGRWTGNPQFFPYSDANGLGPSVYKKCWQIDDKAPVESLIGFIGSSPPNVPEGCHGGITDPGFVGVGNTLSNFAPATTGAIWLRTNDNTNHISNVGQQIAKVIIVSP